jgi:hypothetical protein
VCDIVPVVNVVVSVCVAKKNAAGCMVVQFVWVYACPFVSGIQKFSCVWQMVELLCAFCGVCHL